MRYSHLPSLHRLAPLAAVFASLLLGACSQMPASGPNARAIAEAGTAGPDARTITLVDITPQVVAQLAEAQQPFSETLRAERPGAMVVGPGDLLEVTLWEAPPATLFGASSLDARSTSATGATVLPAQVVDQDGSISIPFAGRIPAAGRTTGAIGEEIAKRLKGKANQPQALVKWAQNVSSTVSVVGEVANNMRMPLSAGGERLLDALALAGGVRQPVGKITLQVTRGNQVHTMALDQVIRDPRQNVPLWPGDVVTALFQPWSLTALGATGRQTELPFEAQGITLAQALGRAGGVIDSRADPQGVFIFRFEPASAATEPANATMKTVDGRVPVVYRLNLRDPASFFAMQNFPMKDRDILYVTNAPLAELQKFINLVFSINRQVLTSVDNLP